MAAEHPWSAVPAELAELLRPGVPAVVQTTVAAVRAEVPEYDQPLEGEFGQLISKGVVVSLNQFIDLLGRDADLPDLSVSEALGRAEHAAGRTLDALQSAYRIGARVAWRAVADAGRANDVEPETMYVLAEAIFAYIDRLAAASVTGYTQAQALQAGTIQARRHALLELLARPAAPDPAELERVGEEAGWPTHGPVAALAVDEGDAVALARRLPQPAIGAALTPIGLVLVADPDGPGRPRQLRKALRDRPAVLGPTLPWTEVHASVTRALAAWPLHTAGRLGDAPLARADEHLVDLLLAADPRLAAGLRQRCLAPLTPLTPGARARAVETLTAWLDAHGDVSAAAQVLHVHPQTVRYRLAAAREVLGDDALDDPARRLELALALRAQQAQAAADAG